jgi:ATP-dependent Lon protease
MPIVKATDNFPARPVVMLVYGVPGVGKTSLSNTAENPVLVDCDRGADRAIIRKDTLVCSKWEDIVAEKETFKQYKTVIIDTAKACLDDFLCDYAMRVDDASKKNKLKMFGYVGDAFKAFVAYLRSINVDLIILAHAAEDKDGDDRIFYPSVTGQSKDLVQRIADQIGFLSYGADNSRVLHFQKNHRIVAKDTARLGDIIIPDATDPAYATAMAKIITATKTRIQERTNAQNEALCAIKDAEEAIAKVVDAATADAALAAINACPSADITALKKKLQPTLKKLNLKFNKESGKFEVSE